MADGRLSFEFTVNATQLERAFTSVDKKMDGLNTTARVLEENLKVDNSTLQSLDTLASKIDRVDDEAHQAARSSHEMDAAVADAAMSGTLLATSITAVTAVIDTAFQIWDRFIGTVGQVHSTISGLIDQFFEISELALSDRMDFVRLSSSLQIVGDAAGFTEQELVDLSLTMAEVTRHNADAIQSAEALLLTFRSVKTDNFERALWLAADLSELLGTGLSESVRGLGKALENPEAGLARLSHQGIVFSEATKLLVRTLIEQGREIEAQEVILKSLEERYGGFARLIGQDVVGQYAILQNKVQDAKEALANAFLPVLEAIISPLKQFADVVGNQLAPELIKMGEAAAEALKPFTEEALEALQAWEDNFATTVAITEVLTQRWAEVLELAVLKIEKAFYDTMITVTVIFIRGFNKLLQYFNDFFSRLSEAWNSVWKKISEDIQKILSGDFSELSSNEIKVKLQPITTRAQDTQTRPASISTRIQELENSLGQAFTDAYLAARKRFELEADDKNLFAPIAKPAEPEPVAPPVLFREFELPKPKEEPEEQQRAREFVGLADLARRIQASAAGQSPELRAALQQVDELEAVNMGLARLEDNLGDKLEKADADIVGAINAMIDSSIERDFEEINPVAPPVVEDPDAAALAAFNAAAKQQVDLLTEISSATAGTHKTLADGNIPAVFQ